MRGYVGLCGVMMGEKQILGCVFVMMKTGCLYNVRISRYENLSSRTPVTRTSCIYRHMAAINSVKLLNFILLITAASTCILEFSNNLLIFARYSIYVVT
jgi:hypothetical protein